MINMERKKPWDAILIVLFSTNLVYFGAFAQTADELYRQLRKNPTQQKELTDKAKTDTVDRERIDRLNRQTQDYKKEVEKADKQMASEPEPVAENSKMTEEEEEAQEKREQASSEPHLKGGNSNGGPAPKSTGQSPPASNSADTPKVAFDPMPDEIQFPGEAEPASVPLAAPGIKRASPTRSNLAPLTRSGSLSPAARTNSVSPATKSTQPAAWSNSASPAARSVATPKKY